MSGMSRKIEETNDSKIITLDSDELKCQYRIEKDFISDKIITKIKKTVRGSLEYKKFIQYIKTYLDVDKCAFYENYSMKNGLTIELHHTPLTITDIIETVANRHLIENEGYSVLGVSQDVTRIHYMFQVGLVPLNPTAHELYHSGKLVIHPDLVVGDWKQFYTVYKEYMTDTAIEKIIKFTEMEEDKELAKTFPKILNRRNIQIIDESDSVKLKDYKLENLFIDKLKNLEKLE